MKIIKTEFCAVITLALVSCATSSLPSNKTSTSDFEKVKIGENQSQVEQLWGKPKIGVERYPSKIFNTLQYREGRVFFTIDPASNQVVSKSIYIDSSEKIYDLKVLKSTYFPDVSWETYVPCHTRSNQDKILVNRKHGFYIATSAENAAFASWATPMVINSRIKLLYKHCPQRQPPNTW